MKTLSFNNEEYQAERIVKTETDIIGYNGDSVVFSFKGISDFTLFELVEGVFDIDENLLLRQKIVEQDMVLEELMFAIIPELMGGGM